MRTKIIIFSLIFILNCKILNAKNTFIFDKTKEGFSNCLSGEKIENDWEKGNVINYLEKKKRITGKIIHVGDGKNDLEVWEANLVNFFIGFGINKIVPEVQKKAPAFVKTIDEFKAIIKKYDNN